LYGIRDELADYTSWRTHRLTRVVSRHLCTYILVSTLRRIAITQQYTGLRNYTTSRDRQDLRPSVPLAALYSFGNFQLAD